MKLDLFVAQLQALQMEGYGDRQVYYRMGSSGDCGKLGSARVVNANEDVEMFDFELDVGEEYIQIYAGS